MAGETEHTLRFAIPKADSEAWEAYERFTEYLEQKGYLRRDGFKHSEPKAKVATKREAE